MRSCGFFFLFLHASLRAPLTYCISLARHISENQGPAKQYLKVVANGAMLRKYNDCLGLSMHGFPLPVHELMRKAHRKKKSYFKYLASVGYDNRLYVAPRGAARQYGSSDLTDFAKRNAQAQILFVGDCLARQSFNAYARSLGLAVPGSATAKMIRSSDGGHMPGFEFVDRNDVQRGWYKHEAAPAFLVPFNDGHIKNLTAKIESLLKENSLDSRKDNVVLWMNYDLWAWYSGSVNWPHSANRAAKLNELISAMKSAFPGARIAWQTTSYIDLVIMKASPEKPDWWLFDHSIKHASENNVKNIDEPFMEKMGVAVVPRYDITKDYRGLQCDGLHHDPRAGQASQSWHCYGFLAIEDLILQSGIAALTGSEEVPICAAS